MSVSVEEMVGENVKFMYGCVLLLRAAAYVMQVLRNERRAWEDG